MSAHGQIMKFTTKLEKIGKNKEYFVNIPSRVTSLYNLKEGDLVEIRLRKVHADADVKARLFRDK